MNYYGCTLSNVVTLCKEIRKTKLQWTVFKNKRKMNVLIKIVDFFCLMSKHYIMYFFATNYWCSFDDIRKTFNKDLFKDTNETWKIDEWRSFRIKHVDGIDRILSIKCMINLFYFFYLIIQSPFKLFFIPEKFSFDLCLC